MTPRHVGNADLIVGEPADLRLLVPAAAAWAAAGLALGWPPHVGLGAALALLALGLACLLGPRRAGLVVAAAALLCAAGAGAASAWRVAALERGPLPGLARAHARTTLRLVVGDDPRLVSVPAGGHGATRAIVVLQAKALRVVVPTGSAVSIRSPVFVLASGRDWLDLQPSQHVSATGRLGVPDPGEMETATFDATGPPSDVGRPQWLQRVAGALRAGLRSAAAPLPAAPGGLLPGLVDGDVSRLPPDVRAEFKTTGLTHLVAVSGANLAIVLGVVLVAARWVGLRLRGQAVAGSVAIAAFVVVARPQPSVLRAAVMGLAAVLALAAGRRRRALPTLCATVLCLMYLDPTLARSVGFALSVLATGALLVLAPPLGARLARRLPRWLADALAVPAAATLVCSPIIASIAGRVSLAAIPANLLAEPAVAPTTVLGVAAAGVAPWWLGGAQVLAWVAAWPCRWLVLVAHTLSGVPGAAVPWPSGATGAIDLVLVLAVAALGLRLWSAGRRA
jgi:competence protein ComEC